MLPSRKSVDLEAQSIVDCLLSEEFVLQDPDGQVIQQRSPRRPMNFRPGQSVKFHADAGGDDKARVVAVQGRKVKVFRLGAAEAVWVDSSELAPDSQSLSDPDMQESMTDPAGQPYYPLTPWGAVPIDTPGKSVTKLYYSRKEALQALESNPLACVEWREGGRKMSAIYWNGKRRIQPADKEIDWNPKREFESRVTK